MARAEKDPMANLIEALVSRGFCGRPLAEPGAPLLLMVSGGSDSTAMAYAFAELDVEGGCDVRDEGARNGGGETKDKASESCGVRLGPLAILHVNHCLRGVASDGDAAFVGRLAEALGIPFYERTIEVGELAAREGANVEAIARRERYRAAAEALAVLCEREGAPFSTGRIVVAHTQDDRVESLFMRAIVGTGPGGWRAMSWETPLCEAAPGVFRPGVDSQDGASFREDSLGCGWPDAARDEACGPFVIRPLLGVSREELRRFVEARAEAGLTVVRTEEGALWREDTTNADTAQLRAFVRHELVPRAKGRNPRLLDTLSRSMDLAADEDDMLRLQSDELAREHVRWLAVERDLNGGERSDPTGGCLIGPSLGKEPLPLQRRVVNALLERILGARGDDTRVDTASTRAVLGAWEGASLVGNPDARPKSGYVANIQGDLAVSANKRGVRIEPMAAFRARRKR